MKLLTITYMKKFIYCALLPFLLISCSLNDQLPISSNQETKSTIVNYSISQPYKYVKNPSLDIWKSYTSTEQMFDACQVPSDTLTKMSTAALVKTCINHPLTFIFSAYNNELKGIDFVIDNSNAFQELLSREDAVKELIDFYSRASVLSDTTTFKRDDYSISISSLNFIELLLASGYFTEINKEENVNALNQAIWKWMENKKSHPEIYSDYSINKSIFLNMVLDNGKISRDNSQTLYDSNYEFQAQQQTKSGGVFINYVYLNTTYGQTVIGYTRTDMTEAEKTTFNAQYISTYPNATFISSSTYTYNCHSYAWNISDGGPNCWINADSSSYLFRYWTNDKYCLSPFQSMGTKIYYYNSDHSAVKAQIAPNYLYISKWGAGPLMRHDPTYGPYSNMGQRNYYRSVGEPDILSGNTITTVGVSNVYEASIKDPSRFSYEWIVENAKGDPVWYSHSPNNYLDTIIFTRQSLFTITCNIYYNNTLIGFQWLEVAVEQ